MMGSKVFVAVAVVLLLCCSFCGGVFSKSCSWRNCGEWKEDMINVHIIAHSHDDAGWLVNVDEYYYGYPNNPGVQYILNTVVHELQVDPRRKFSYCESSFFFRWFDQQSDFFRHPIKKLLEDGQLEFINGGWVSNDEAAAHYVAQIEQMTLGLSELNHTFGECAVPKVAWQVDPFGHSREQASLYAQMGMNGLYFSRLHWLDHEKRIHNRTPEMVWHGSHELGYDGDLFTGIFETGSYYPPPGFCWDAYCDDEPLMDDKRLEGYNLDRKLDEFIKWVEKEQSHYLGNHIMVLAGGDFQWSNANHWFANLDKLIYHVNRLQKTNDSKINVFYSTPACYTLAKNKANLMWPSKNDDFFPYGSAKHDYWTGYFTSRPTFKGIIRKVSGDLQTCKQMSVLANLGPMDLGDIRKTC